MIKTMSSTANRHLSMSKILVIKQVHMNYGGIILKISICTRSLLQDLVQEDGQGCIREQFGNSIIYTIEIITQFIFET